MYEYVFFPKFFYMCVCVLCMFKLGQTLDVLFGSSTASRYQASVIHVKQTCVRCYKSPLGLCVRTPTYLFHYLPRQTREVEGLAPPAVPSEDPGPPSSSPMLLPPINCQQVITRGSPVSELNR